MLQDPNQNRIGQWLDVRPKQGIAELSLQLAAELSLGTYTISAQSFKSSSVQSSTFKVEERGKENEERDGRSFWFVACLSV